MHTYVIDEHSLQAYINLLFAGVYDDSVYSVFAHTAHSLFFVLFFFFSFFCIFIIIILISLLLLLLYRETMFHGVNLKLSHRIVNVNSIIAQNKPLTTLYKYSMYNSIREFGFINRILEDST